MVSLSKRNRYSFAFLCFPSLPLPIHRCRCAPHENVLYANNVFFLFSKNSIATVSHINRPRFDWNGRVIIHVHIFPIVHQVLLRIYVRWSPSLTAGIFIMKFQWQHVVVDMGDRSQRRTLTEFSMNSYALTTEYLFCCCHQAYLIFFLSFPSGLMFLWCFHFCFMLSQV